MRTDKQVAEFWADNIERTKVFLKDNATAPITVGELHQLIRYYLEKIEEMRAEYSDLRELRTNETDI